MDSAETAHVATRERPGPAEVHGALEFADVAASLRLVCRGSGTSIAAALGLAEPSRVCKSTTAGDIALLRLGPDEYLVLGPEAQRHATLEAIKATQAPGDSCVVDVSDRTFGIVLANGRVEDILASACPLDLSLPAFPVGVCTRTIFGKVEVILWRTGPHAFRLEAGRSFKPYVTDLLALCARGLPTVPA